MAPGKTKFGPGFGKLPKYTRKAKPNKKLAKLKSRKAKKLPATHSDQKKLIGKLAVAKGLPKEIEGIIVKKARVPMNPKLKKDIKIAARFRKVQNSYYGSKLMDESKDTFYKLDQKYRNGLVNALELDIKDNVHPGLFLWIRDNWQELVSYIGNRSFMTRSSTRHFVTYNYTNNSVSIPSKVNFRTLVTEINDYLWVLDDPADRY